MAWNAALPANNTKIRNTPTILTDNFAAIEQGDLSLAHWQVNFTDRDNVPGAPPPTSDPTRQDDTVILFSKTDSGNSELFMMDAQNPANTLQLSANGYFGSATTQFRAQDISFKGSVVAFDKNNVIAVYGTFNPTADSVLDSFGCTIAPISSTSATVSFGVLRGSAEFIVTANSNNGLVNLGTQSTTAFTLSYPSGLTRVSFMVCGA